MVRIRDLRRFIRRRLNLEAGTDWVDFKVIPREYYEKRDWAWAKHIRVGYRRGKKKPFEVVDFGNELFSETREWRFYTLTGALNFIMRTFPPEEYVYYHHWFSKPDKNYVNVRWLFGFTMDEAEAWKVILARAMGHLNGRTLVGFRTLRNTSKECDICGDRAVIQLVFDYRGIKYSVYYCRKCFTEAVHKLWANLLKKAGMIKDEMLKLVEPSEKETEEYYMK